VTPEDFAGIFDRFQVSAFRLEALPVYSVDEFAEEFEAWLAGEPLPEYTVYTSPWLARIARDTRAGKSWQRVHIVDLPPNDYLRWELAYYHAQAAVGEDIRIAIRADNPQLADLTDDYWLFDAGGPRPFAVEMIYDDAGRPGEHHLITDPARIAAYHRAQATAWSTGQPLAEFLAAHPLPLTA